MDSVAETFARWKKLVGDESEDPWETEDDLMFFLHNFPPTGEGLERVVEGLPHGQQVLKRLLEVFQAVASADEDGGSEFRVEPVLPVDEDQVRTLLTDHARNLYDMAQYLKDDDALALIGNPPELVQMPASETIDADMDVEMYLNDIRTDFHSEVAVDDPSENPLWYLTEALYTLGGNNYCVRDYVLWPLYLEQSPLKEPHRSDYQLWLLDVEHLYVAPGVIQYTLPEA